MKDRTKTFYEACLRRNARYDGVFFLGVTSTKIYCRPVCKAKKPKFENCRFYENAALAEKNGFRPCLRCRPELAPGAAPSDDANRITKLFSKRLQAGILDEKSVAVIADEFEISERQLRRILQHELGVTPTELIRTRRLLRAKQLLTDTALPITEVAFKSGFSSLRRFNDAFKKQYRMAPSALRKKG